MMWEQGIQGDDEEEIILLKPSDITASADPLIDSLISGVGNVSVSGSSRILLVLDLNGLLVQRVHLSEATKAEKKLLLKNLPHGPKKSTKYLAWLRPNIENFLEFVFERYDVIVWSSAKRMNIDGLLNISMSPEQQKYLVDIYDQSYCEEIGLHPTDNQKPLFLKELGKIWSKYPRYNAENTLLIDDSYYKAVKNPPGTAIHPKEWTRVETRDSKLAKGGSIREYLEALYNASKVSSYAGVPDFVETYPFDSGFSKQELDEAFRLASIALEYLEAAKQDHVV